MKLKKIGALVLAGTMILSSLTACSQKTAEESSSGDAATTTTEEATTSSDGTLTTDNITITMMYSGTATENDFETQVLPKLVQEAFPNITLEVTKLPDDQYYTALKTKLASGEAPDIILLQPKYAGANSIISLAQAGYLEPLTELKAVELGGEAARESYRYGNDVYGIGSGATMLGTYYNKDMFEANGLSVPTNWDEFLNCCQVLQDAGIQPIVMGDKDMYVMQFGLYQIAANQVYADNAAFDDQLRTGETKFTDEGTWDKVLEMYKTLYDKGYIQNSSLGIGAQQAIQKFVDGEAAMTFDGSFNAAAIQASGTVEFERGYFPLPGNDAGEDLYASVAIGGGPGIYSGSKHIDEAKAILELWFDGESDIWKAYVDAGNIVATYGYGSDQVNPLFQTFVDLYNEGKSFYWCNQGWPAGTESEMEALFSEAIGGQGTTVSDIVEGMQLKFQELYTE
ncbi:ABC transporter substrate-binding protein [Konateibacter massiliensis]|uniref:ABC transporter substrate-binding protein n=1 Tax=Konateibacter massiliensis TaxID=2002841 RepID=UPI000C14A13C|nr:extracellular solute-binding protein [Konateibacter massiliensis]